MDYLQFLPLRVFVKVVPSTSIMGKNLKRIKLDMPKHSGIWFIVIYVVISRLPLYQAISTSSVSLMIAIGKLGYLS
jgi:hypothetical protein